MPELPDVEVMRKRFESAAIDKKISSMVVFDHRVLAETGDEELRIALEGDRFVHTKRHGKYLLAGLAGGDWIAFHFGMTGCFSCFADPTQDPEHDSVRFDFEDGTHVAYESTRKLGEVRLIQDEAAYLLEKGLGMDALDPGLTEQRFEHLFSGRRGKIKTQLMNQKIMAGLGNIYTDEILFQSGIHPHSEVQNLTSSDWSRIYHAMHMVIETAVEKGANPDLLPARFLIPNRHTGGKCPVCGSELSRIRISGRWGYACSKCQLEPS
jgi:formamidopyrimidine-DNA glycosylase